jgi:hypothetical protein
MVNRARGEAELMAGGKSYRLLLTLGALAEIEDGLGLDDLSGVGARLARTRAADLAIVVAALLRGGGHDACPADVLKLPCELGALMAAVTAAFQAAGLEQKSGGSSETPPFAGANGSNLALGGCG